MLVEEEVRKRVGQDRLSAGGWMPSMGLAARRLAETASEHDATTGGCCRRSNADPLPEVEVVHLGKEDGPFGRVESACMCLP